MDEIKAAEGGATEPAKVGGKTALTVSSILAALALTGGAIDVTQYEAIKASALADITQSESTIEARPVDVAAITPGSAASRMGILADTSLRSNPRKRDSLMAVAYTKDSLDNAKHTPVMQQGPVDMPKVQVEAGRVATMTVIVSDADGSNAVVMQSSKIVSDAGDGLMTDIYAGYRIAQNQPKDKP